jgi:hypothetical protein
LALAPQQEPIGIAEPRLKLLAAAAVLAGLHLTCPDTMIQGAQVRLQAERDGGGNGSISHVR